MFLRHTLLGVSLNVCDAYLPRVTSSLLTKSNINFVIKISEGRCGKCGIKNEGAKLNPFPWFVAIKETLLDEHIYHTGTLVSKEWIVTTASIFVNTVAIKNFEALVGATAFDVNVANSNPIGIIVCIVFVKVSLV